MGLFTKKYNLVKVWRKIKADAEKARKGKKPGGKMGFESKIEKLDKAVLKSAPDPDDILKQTAALTGEMLQYASKLPPDEKEFASDIKDFVHTLKEIARAVEINVQQVGTQNKKLLESRNKLSRVNQICDAVFKRLQKLKAQLQNSQGTQQGLAALAKEIKSTDDDVQKLGKEMGEHFEVVMKLTG